MGVLVGDIGQQDVGELGEEVAWEKGFCGESEEGLEDWGVVFWEGVPVKELAQDARVLLVLASHEDIVTVTRHNSNTLRPNPHLRIPKPTLYNTLLNIATPILPSKKPSNGNTHSPIFRARVLKGQNLKSTLADIQEDLKEFREDWFFGVAEFEDLIAECWGEFVAGEGEDVAVGFRAEEEREFLDDAQQLGLHL